MIEGLDDNPLIKLTIPSVCPHSSLVSHGSHTILAPKSFSNIEVISAFEKSGFSIRTFSVITTQVSSLILLHTTIFPPSTSNFDFEILGVKSVICFTVSFGFVLYFLKSVK